VIDVHGPMAEYIAARRWSDPDFALAPDAIHPNDLGHWLVAKSVLQALGATDVQADSDARQTPDK
jgi:hypothetical protein